MGLPANDVRVRQMDHETCTAAKIAIIIPAFRAGSSIVDVVRRIGNEAVCIVVVDDACPEKSGRKVQQEVNDPRVEVIFNHTNLGVGGAMVVGYRRALESGVDICVKLDADGQMDPELIPTLVAPILWNEADYAKGNRFFHIRDVADMPWVRLVGNAALSFFSKLSSGYWNIFDPTNGFTAIHRVCLENIDLENLDPGFFFESDLLFRLRLIDAVVVDIPMRAIYAEEKSNLSPAREAPRFFMRHAKNFLKRIFYEYYLRDFNLASVQLMSGLSLIVFSGLYGGGSWLINLSRGVESPAGTVGVVSIAMTVGFLLVQGFLSFDYARIPATPIIRKLGVLRCRQCR